MLLDTKAFSPHFISNLTRLDFAGHSEDKLLSMKDIMAVFESQNQASGKYFFKCDNLKQQKQDRLPNIHHLQSCAQFKSERNLRSSSKKLVFDMNQQRKVNYLSVEFRKIKLSVDGKDCFFLMALIENLTPILSQQQSLSDEMYQEAIESNYSHEQMTPLNSILGCSTIVLESFQEQHLESSSLLSLTKLIRENSKMLRCIHQSGSAMYLYNMNQIMRMKLNKNQFTVNTQQCLSPLEHVERVIYPFVPKIMSTRIRVMVSDQIALTDVRFMADWSKFELVLFNLVQNAVKYNDQLGILLVVLKLLPGGRVKNRKKL